jgi:hypothetical protein
MRRSRTGLGIALILAALLAGAVGTTASDPGPVLPAPLSGELSPE